MRSAFLWWCLALVAVALSAVVATIFLLRGNAPPTQVAAPQCAHWSVFRCAQLLGVSVEMDTLVDLLPPSDQGHSMLQIARTLEKIGLATEGFRKSIDDLATDRTFPCVAHIVRPDHFVVVSGMDEGFMHVYDGSGRRVSVPRAALAKRWGREILVVKRMPHSAPLPAYLSRNTAAPCIQFETLLLDKGTVAPTGDDVCFEYPFRNVGRSDLVIEKVETECGCLRSERPEQPIPADGRGAIRLFYRVEAKRGSFEHRALVKSNDPSAVSTVLVAAGFSGGQVRVFPEAIALGEVPWGAPCTAYCFVKYTGDQPGLSVREVSSSLEGAALTYRTPTTLDPAELRQLWPHAPDQTGLPPDVRVLKFSITPTEDKPGTIKGTIVVHTNIESYEQFSVRVFGKCVAPVKLYPSVLSFGAVRPEERIRRTIKLSSLVEAPFRIVAIENAGPIEHVWDVRGPSRENAILFSGSGEDALRASGTEIILRASMVLSGEEKELVLPLRVSAWESRAVGEGR